MFLPSVPELISKVCPWKPKIILILRNPVDRAYSHFMMDIGKHRIEDNSSFEKFIELELKTMKNVGLTNVPVLPSIEWDSLGPSKNHLFHNPPKNMTEDEKDHAHWMVYRIRHMRNYLQRGIYSVQLERWMKYFKLNESLMVINNDQLNREPRKIMRKVLRFLNAPEPDYFEDDEVDVSLQEKALRSNSGVSSLLSVGGYDPMNNSTRHFLEKFYKPYNDQLADLLGEEWRGIWEPNTSAAEATI